ncbi:MAG: DUF2868 domain-containing protein [Gammaproteobacteria bacterium]|nr:DUF2868 domain-containing protein [Gammaproteobacteria bacterium]MDH3507404.1 DUF2868 domain-containing protein [Gammaproteobacteria bacterium]
MYGDRSLFEDAVDIPLWLDADRATPYADRVSRDRDAIRGRATSTELNRVRAWWDAIGPSPSTGASLDRGRHLIGFATIVMGALAGIGLAAAALHYDGTYPVNAVTVFSLLVGVQLVLIAITMLLLPHNVPGLRNVQGVLAQANPAGVVAAVYGRITVSQLPESVRELFTWHIGRAAAGRFAKWQLLHWSQGAAIAFNLAALATALALVTFTDLAFGWSTTLQLSGDELARWIGIIVTPWAEFVPAAVPDAAMIEASRFFRLESSAATLGAPESYTGWWPFLMVSMIVYGLLPRIALWIFAGLRLRAATRALLLEDARVTALIDRMASPALATTALVDENPHRLEAAPKQRHRLDADAPTAALIWSEAIDKTRARERAHRVLGVELTAEPLTAGGGASLAEDAAVIDSLAECAPRQVVVFVRAYEPPLLEFMDALTRLRKRLGPNTSLIVHPVPELGNELAPADVETWHRSIAARRDPKIYVESGV